MAPANFKIQELSPDKFNEKICKVILQSARRHIPKGKTYTYKPFWNKHLEKLKKDREEARRRAEATKDVLDVIEWRRKSAVMRRELIQAKKNCFSNFISKLSYRKETSKVFKFISSLDGKPQAYKEPTQVGGKNIYDDKDLATAYNKFFTKNHPLTKELREQEKKFRSGIKIAWQNQSEEIFNDDFTIHELQWALNSLKSKKSPGCDMIFAEFLKNLGPVAQHTLCTLFNKSWNEGVPAAWKKAIVVPILKPKKSGNSY